MTRQEIARSIGVGTFILVAALLIGALIVIVAWMVG
jgi:hypothetical protein